MYIYVRRIVKDAIGKFANELDLDLYLDGDVKKSKGISWLSTTSGDLISVDLIHFEYLLTKDKLEKEDQLKKFLTSVTEFRSPAFLDCNVAGLPEGAHIRFEHQGYYKLGILYKKGSRMVF